MNLKNSVFIFVMLISFFSCGSNEGDDITVDGPSNLVISANIVGQDVAHPYGNGSGTITLNFLADNATLYKINLGNGETKETSANELTYSYSGAGLKTFEINIYAYNGFEFISSSISVTVQIGSPPSNLVVEASIIGQDETHLNGDGSGTITLNFSADNATLYRINLGNGETKETSANELTYTYSGEGLKTYDIYISAYNDDQFITAYKSITIQIGSNNNNGLNLVWSDEFDGDGAINSNKWFHQTQLPAGGNWYNGEVQHYTNRIENSYVSDGTLKIVAKKESFTDQGYTKQYTSARLNSKFAFKYGRVEVRAKLPSVAGTWPAIWMLGKNINEAGGFWYNEGFGTNWPACGEIDIMEPNIAKTEILGTWHWNNGSGYQMNSAYVNKSNAETSQNFHNYILEWSPSEMKIYIDNTLINQMTTVNPFNEEFYILFNIAMGGSLGGTIDSNFTEDTMEIDYIRVYQESTASVADENWFEDVLLYPNPVKDNLTIKVPAHLLGAKATIYSLLGQELNSFVQKESTMNVNLSHYKKGVYILRFENNNKLATYKIFKM